MTGRPVIGILLAVLVETARWTKFRWDFTEESAARAWRFTTIATALAAVLVFLDSSPYQALPNLLTWLPVLLLPMQFVQSYGLNDSMALNTFSFLANHRRKRNLRLGLPDSVARVNFGNIYFVTAMIASTLGRQSNGWPFLPGIIVLTGWMLLSASRSRPVHMAIALTLAGGIAVVGQLGLQRLQDFLGNSGPSRSGFNPNSNTTLIGKPGAVVQSPDIVWRLRPRGNSMPPALLRTATYNAYGTGRWAVQPVVEAIFEDLDTVEPITGEVYQLLAANTSTAEQEAAVRAELPRFSLRGGAIAETPLALPGDAASTIGFALDGIERNSFGTVRVYPRNSVIEGSVLWKGSSYPESPPFAEDLIVRPPEEDILQDVISELSLDGEAPLQEKLRTLHGWFQKNFSYTRTLTISDPGFTSGPTSIGQFLTTSRAGHCEYFATAATLLLRQAKIPARYSIGYAVNERDGKRHEFVLRGTHHHAWCRVWDSGQQRWLDFDPTPGTWFSTVARQTTRMQDINDAIKRFREDFFLWRNRPENRLAATLVMSAIALGVLAFIVRRLWKSKRRLDSEMRTNGYVGPVIRTPLNALEPRAEKRLGVRPPGRPLGDWLVGLCPSLQDRSLLEEAIQLHQRLRFDPKPAVQGEQERLEELAKRLDSELRRG